MAHFWSPFPDLLKNSLKYNPCRVICTLSTTVDGVRLARRPSHDSTVEMLTRSSQTRQHTPPIRRYYCCDGQPTGLPTLQAGTVQSCGPRNATPPPAGATDPHNMDSSKPSGNEMAHDLA
ncbi:hypothetical protein HPB48_005618 [Haemaphysalis longicornis]|uniref:Uncharacterized protein n=1 Tax=Haemaphysalis longicornis TaxID=44386 RepID=A0A9J6GFZ5_HAELO|nr:hypothetical protein HPB48_005618 [Haemaphysalis longicornis]